MIDNEIRFDSHH